MTATFGIVDYCLFGITLLFSLAIGGYFALKGRKKSHEHMFTGGGKMAIIPTALSLTTSFLSGVTLLGVPAEIYKRGILLFVNRFSGTFISCLVGIFITLPILFDLQPISVYEYFEVRFHSKFLRKACASIYLLFMLVYMGVVLYAPAIALSGVTGVQAWIFYCVVGFICNLYTSFGGLKAVVWTDTFQFACMLTGLIALVVKGFVVNGGIGRTLTVAAEYGRIQPFLNVDPDPFQYSSVWAASFGGMAFWLALITFNQISVQRYFSMGSLARAQKVLWTTLPGYVILVILADVLGLVMFVFYLGCDPIRSKQISLGDQLVIRYALDAIGEYPGLPGVFLACLFSGTLSTISSGINSMAAVLWEDFLKDMFPNLSAVKKTQTVTGVALTFGFLAIGMAGMAEPLGGLVSAALSALGALGGPICGLFLLGMLFPRASRIGAIAGLLVSVAVTCFIAVGSVILKPYAGLTLELPVDQCPANMTDEFLSFNGTWKPSPSGLPYLFTMSEMVFPILGILLVIIVGYPLSFIFKETDREKMIARKDSEFRPLKPRLTIQEFWWPSKEREANNHSSHALRRNTAKGTPLLNGDETNF